jgi:hypothetical protein
VETKHKSYQPKTGQPCGCKKGIMRNNCPACEGTGWRIDFAAIRARAAKPQTNKGEA